jgi:acetylornithine deacetylase
MRALEHLAALVAADTRNPPRSITGDGPLYAYLESQLTGFALELVDHGEGCVSLLAVRGRPRLLFNFHVDTVPAAPSWSRDPLALHVADGRAVGLGAADTKGAAACMLAAVEQCRGPVALLFTSDEEAGDSRCVLEFLARHAPPRPGDGGGAGGAPPPYDCVLVAEPTGARAVLAHRGLASAAGTFHGVAGHSSSPRALHESAVHAAVRWAGRALAAAEAEEAREIGGLTGIRFNLGVLRGGQKSNMIADQAEVRFGVRTRPGEAPAELLSAFEQYAPASARVEWQTTCLGPSLPPSGPAGAHLQARAADLARTLGIEVAPPVDFWTEASLFAAAGLPAFVFGPGDIAQAHAADEWVSLSDLAAVTATYLRAIG